MVALYLLIIISDYLIVNIKNRLNSYLQIKRNLHIKRKTA